MDVSEFAIREWRTHAENMNLAFLQYGGKWLVTTALAIVTELEQRAASLQQRVEALERVRFWAQSYMTSAGADMSSQRTARAGLVQALAAAQEQGEG